MWIVSYYTYQIIANTALPTTYPGELMQVNSNQLSLTVASHYLPPYCRLDRLPVPHPPVLHLQFAIPIYPSSASLIVLLFFYFRLYLSPSQIQHISSSILLPLSLNQLP